MTIKTNNIQVGLDIASPSTNNWTLEAPADGTLKIQQGSIGGSPTTKITINSGSIVTTGSITATSFSGSGVGLTGVTADAAAGGAIYENVNTINTNYTLTAGRNGMSAGPITIADGASVTVPDGAAYVIV